MNITIKGTPISKMRPRLGKHCTFDPQSLIKMAVTTSIKREMDLKRLEWPLNDAFSVDMTFYFQPNKNLSKAKRNAKLSNSEPCLVRNDLDNLEKFYCDCANGVLYDDDHQIVELSSRKLWSDEPRVEIKIERYKPKEMSND